LEVGGWRFKVRDWRVPFLRLREEISSVVLVGVRIVTCCPRQWSTWTVQHSSPPYAQKFKSC
jgi:hypothetical protein